MIDFNETSYILGYWMTSYDDVDIYVIAYKNGNEYVARQTFRYHSDNPDPYSGEDRKSIYTIKFNDNIKNDDEAIEFLDDLFKFHGKRPDFTSKSESYIKYNFQDRTIIKGNSEDLVNKMKEKPYMHFKEIPSDSVN
jgi:hypothetical protein